MIILCIIIFCVAHEIAHINDYGDIRIVLAHNQHIE